MIEGSQENVIKFIEEDLQRRKNLRHVKLMLLGFGTVLIPMILGLGLRESVVGAFEPRVFLPNFLACILLGTGTFAIYGKRFSSRKAFNWIWLFLILSVLLSTERIFFPTGTPTYYASASQFWHENMGCFLKGLLSAGVAGIWLTLFAFFFSPWPSRRYRAVISLAGGVSGAIMLGFHCDSSSVGHVLISHVGQGVILGAILFQIQDRTFRIGLRRVFPNLFAKLKRPERIG